MARDKAFWEHNLFRIVFMALFLVASRIAGMVLVALTVVQAIYVLIKEEQHRPVQQFQVQLALYQKEIGTYVAYNHDNKPFPFSDWPNTDKEMVAADEDEAPIGE